jgi:hypothetical protein
MIITRETTIKINESNQYYYEELGYDVFSGEEIIIPIELLQPGSHFKISCKCDGCGIVKDVIYKNYIKYGNNWGEYYCRKCSEKKRKKTLNENHGVDYPIQSIIIRDKIKKTMIDKFGVDNPSKRKRKRK